MESVIVEAWIAFFGKRHLAHKEFNLCKVVMLSSSLPQITPFCFFNPLTLARPRGSPLTSKIVWR